jgi:NADH:ubiquinone reductase (non-electrogenic)
VLFKNKKEVYPQLEEYAMYFESSANDGEPTRNVNVQNAVMGVFNKAKDLTSARVGSNTVKKGQDAVAQQIQEVDIDGNLELDQDEFRNLLVGIDSNLRSFPATAQVAAQEGKYLAKLFATGKPDGTFESYEQLKKEKGPFTYFHKGALAYLGSGSAAFDVPIIGAITGPVAGLAWKGYETISQVSWKNRALVAWDWVRTEVFGRDTSR